MSDPRNRKRITSFPHKEFYLGIFLALLVTAFFAAVWWIVAK